MHTISTTVIKIFKPEDISLIDITQKISIEIYAKGFVFPFDKIKGNIKVRAKNCIFPNLSEVNGDLSIDASNANFPALKEVNGSLHIHEEEIILPKLAVVLGDLEIHEFITLPNLKIVTGKIKKKITNIVLPEIINVDTDPFIIISSQKEFDGLKNVIYKNLEIVNTSITVENTIFYGSLKLVKASCNAPNLIKIGGRLILENNLKEDFFKSPKLDIIKKGCTVLAQHQNIHVKEIHGKLTVDGSYNSFPLLKSVKKLNLSEKSLGFNTPQLIHVEKQSAIIGELIADKLETLNIDHNYRFQHCLPNLKKINGNLELSSYLLNKTNTKTVFNTLEVINGNYTLHERIKTPCLQHVYGRIALNNTIIKLAAIKTIKKLVGSKQDKESFVKHNLDTLETIHSSEYFKVERKGLVKEFYHHIKESEYITRKRFYIERWTGYQHSITLKQYVRILKMRHSSYQNYIQREVTREWKSELNPDLEIILATLKKHWNKVTAYTYNELFTLDDINIKRFSFNYVGVSEMMKALDATRVATDGILVKYYKYDTEGNKTIVEKHNVFETYKANLGKNPALRRWSWDSRIVNAYAVKCWCTSTNKEHWLWIEEQYKNKPLEAIASTFRVHKNIIPHIKCLKRQGDVLLCEMKQKVIPEGEIIPLTAAQYFKLLVAES